MDDIDSYSIHFFVCWMIIYRNQLKCEENLKNSVFVLLQNFWSKKLVLLNLFIWKKILFNNEFSKLIRCILSLLSSQLWKEVRIQVSKGAKKSTWSHCCYHGIHAENINSHVRLPRPWRACLGPFQLWSNCTWHWLSLPWLPSLGYYKANWRQVLSFWHYTKKSFMSSILFSMENKKHHNFSIFCFSNDSLVICTPSMLRKHQRSFRILGEIWGVALGEDVPASILKSHFF